MSKRIFLIVFIEGGALLSLQILFAQSMAPFFGSSVFVYTTLLGAAMTAMTLGYFAGGFFSRKSGNKNFIPRLFAVSGTLTSSIPVIFHQWSPYSFDFSNTILMAGYCWILLFPVLFFTSAISVIAIKQEAKETNLAVKTGKIFSVQSMGGIVFAVITGFFLLPLAGTALSYFLLSSVLMLMAVFSMRKKIKYFFLLLLIPVVLNFISGRAHINENEYEVIYFEEGLKGNIIIADSRERNFRLMLINGLPQSMIDNKTGKFLENYSIDMASHIIHRPAVNNVLLLGMGGGGLTTMLGENKNIKTTVVEIDDRVAYCAEKYFIPDSVKYELVIDDARHFIKTNEKKYDVIVADFHTGDVIPGHLNTVESFTETRNSLNEGGLFYLYFPYMAEKHTVYAFNSIIKTLMKAGFFVYSFNYDYTMKKNMILICSAGSVADESLVIHPQPESGEVIYDDTQKMDILLSGQLNYVFLRKNYFE